MIVTLDEVKANLNITNTDQDALIEVLIPQAQSLYENVRGIDFFKFQGSGLIGDKLNVTYYQIEEAKKGMVIESSVDDGSTYRGKVVYNDSFDGVLTIEPALTTDLYDTEFIFYPLSAQYIASKIVEFLIESNDNLKSETIGNYSYTKEEKKQGLPLSLYDFIEKYQGVK